MSKYDDVLEVVGNINEIVSILGRCNGIPDENIPKGEVLQGEVKFYTIDGGGIGFKLGYKIGIQPGDWKFSGVEAANCLATALNALKKGIIEKAIELLQEKKKLALLEAKDEVERISKEIELAIAGPRKKCVEDVVVEVPQPEVKIVETPKPEENNVPS